MRNDLFASTMQLLAQHTVGQHVHIVEYFDCRITNPWWLVAGMPRWVCRWLMAAGKRPVPFRTRKLSPPAPMVLPPGGSGRVGYRRPNNFTHKHPPHNRLCGGCLFVYQRLLPAACGCPHCGQPHPPPTIGVHPRIVRINTTPPPTQNRPGETQHRRRFVHNRCPAWPPRRPLTLADLRFADNTELTNNGYEPTNEPGGEVAVS